MAACFEKLAWTAANCGKARELQCEPVAPRRIFRDCDKAATIGLALPVPGSRPKGVCRNEKSASMILSRYEAMIARRYLLPGKGEGFIFLAASISVVAVALGVAALIIVMSVMNGFRAELYDKIVGLNGHAVVQGHGGRLADWREVLKEVRATPGVTEASPLIEQPLLATHNGRVEAILARGMQVSDILKNPTLKGKTQDGDIGLLAPGSRACRHWLAACVQIGRARGGAADDHQSGRADDALWHGAARNIL